MFAFLSKHIKTKAVYKETNCVEYMLMRDQIVSLPLYNPPYQTDLDMTKVDAMIESYHLHPEFGRFKNTIVIAIRMTSGMRFYLVDGQHRVEMMKQQKVEYPFRVLFYPIYHDDEMRQLFREMNYDSHKNASYVSLGTDTAKIADELYDFFKENDYPFATKKETTESRLYTTRVFVDKLSEYIKEFKDVESLKHSLHEKQKDFLRKVDVSHPYAEEKKCIESRIIFPLKNCNFLDYLMNDVVPEYTGRKRQKPASLRTMVWAHHVGMHNGVTTCPVCEVRTIYQDSFDCGHIQAKSKGGKDIVENLRPICSSCNSSMGTQNMNEFIDKLKHG